MKLSEMNTRQMADALCKLAEPIGNMVADKQFTDAFASAHHRRADCPCRQGRAAADPRHAL